MIVMIDNYDSFTYNLVQMLGGLGADLKIFRNDAATVEEIVALAPAAVVISPGPCTPEKAGISVALIRCLSGKVPLLGVCLGHQSIGVAFGATVAGAQRIMHGKVSQITFTEGASRIYSGLHNPFTAGRYHSLAVMASSVTAALIPDAFSEDGEIMGMHHIEHPTYGIQFHPESILTPTGKRMLRNFLEMTKRSSWIR